MLTRNAHTCQHSSNTLELSDAATIFTLEQNVSAQQCSQSWPSWIGIALSIASSPNGDHHSIRMAASLTRVMQISLTDQMAE